MRSIDQFQFYQLSQFLRPLADLKDEQPLKDVWFPLWRAASWLDFLAGDHLVGLVVSKTTILRLISTIRRLVPSDINELTDEIDKPLVEHDHMFVFELVSGFKEFETVFAAELRTLPSYIVSRKGIYDTSLLIEHAEKAFDEATRKAIPDSAVKDFREAGRCLAFELPTAAGFHAMRCTEATLRKYHALTKNLAAGAKSPDWLVCLNEIKASGGNQKVTGVLDQIRDLHRNPVSHPDEFLDTNQALALFDVAKSAVVAMASEIAALEAAQKAAPAATVAAPRVVKKAGP